jgi:hypothetical protein
MRLEFYNVITQLKGRHCQDLPDTFLQATTEISNNKPPLSEHTIGAAPPQEMFPVVQCVCQDIATCVLPSSSPLGRFRRCSHCNNHPWLRSLNFSAIGAELRKKVHIWGGCVADRRLVGCLVTLQNGRKLRHLVYVDSDVGGSESVKESGTDLSHKETSPRI